MVPINILDLELHKLQFVKQRSIYEGSKAKSSQVQLYIQTDSINQDRKEIF